MPRGRKPRLLLFSSMEISSASIVDGFIQSSSTCKTYSATIYALCFVTSLLFRLTHILCVQRKPLKLLVRKRSSGGCTTNYLRTKQRWRIVTSHATPAALVLGRRDLRTI